MLELLFKLNQIHSLFKLPLQWMAWICLGCAWAFGPICQAQSNARPPAIPALELDGEGDYVLLPDNTFSDLETVTVEAWVKWTRFQSMSRVFGFSLKGRLINMHNRYNNPNLWVSQYRKGTRTSIQLSGLLPKDQWIHLAVVSEADSINVFLNGIMVFDQFLTDKDTFQSKDFSRFNMLGRGNARVLYERDEDFHGQMAEVRIWDHARRIEEIKSNLNVSMTGSEPGLVALYNFSDPEKPGKDTTGHGLDGTFKGDAKAIIAHFPDLISLSTPIEISGDVRSFKKDKVVSGAPVFVTSEGRILQSVIADKDGEFHLFLKNVKNPFRIWAISDQALGHSEIQQPQPGTQSKIFLIISENSQNGTVDLSQSIVGSLNPKQPLATKMAAIKAIEEWKLSNSSIITALISVLEDPNSDVREHAAIALDMLPLPTSLAPVFEKRNRSIAFLFSGLFLPFAVFHLLLYAYFPKERSNLYFAGFAVMSAWYTLHQAGTGAEAPDHFISLFSTGLGITTSLFGLRLLYSFFYDRLPRYYWWFLIAAAVGILTGGCVEHQYPRIQ
ncbi:MAG: hypothetical protein HOH33_15170, partial [Verrucomicrobia bacterium]|nr:hypothetical protein [Verrucomicrobiota bacterium]